MATAEEDKVSTGEPASRIEESAEQNQTRIAGATDQGLHIVEDVVYALVAVFLVCGAFIALGVSAYHFANDVSKNVKDAIEAALEWLLIVFILVELLSAVRSAIKNHQLVAEPFLLVGILAAIKEMVVVATFRIESQKTSDAVLKIGVLGAVVVALAVASFVLRLSQRATDRGRPSVLNQRSARNMRRGSRGSLRPSCATRMGGDRRSMWRSRSGCPQVPWSSGASPPAATSR